jgi:hypothetical protein
MLHYSAAVKRSKSITDLARGFRLVLEKVEYLSPPRIGEGLEYEIVIFLS